MLTKLNIKNRQRVAKFRKVQKQKTTAKVNSAEPYKSVQTLAKAVKKVELSLPEESDKKLAVL